MPRAKKERAEEPPAAGERKKSQAKTIFPKPQAYAISNSSFENWLRTFNSECRPLVELNLYRDKPRINLKQIAFEKKERNIWHYKSSLDAEQIVFQPGFTFREFILKNKEWGGEGDYRLLCNEAGVTGAIASTLIKISDPDYPPCIDPRSIVIGHPDNIGLIKGLRAKGIRLPGDNPALDQIEEQEQEEMTVAQSIAQPLIESTIRQNEELRGTLEQVREEMRGQRRDPSPTTEAIAMNRGIEVMADGCGKAMEMVANQAKEVSKASAPLFDPVALFKTGMEAGNRPDNSIAVAELFIKSSEKQLEQFKTMHDKTMDVMKQMLAERGEEEPPEPVQRTEGTAFDDLDRQMERAERYAKLFGWKRNQENAPAAAAPAQSGILDKIGMFLANNPMMGLAVLALGANIVYNFRSSTPLSPEKALEAAGVPKGALPPLPGVNGAQPAAAPEPAAAPNAQEQAQANWRAFMEFITPHFLNHYGDPAGVAAGIRALRQVLAVTS